jgi:hypothetical protein
MDGSWVLNIVEGGKQEPLTLNLTSQAQAPWMSPQTTTYDLCMVSITSKWDMGTMTRLVVNQEWVSRFNEGQGRKKGPCSLNEASWAQSP